MEIKNFVFNLLSENTMLVIGGHGRCVAVDPSWYSDDERRRFFDYLEFNSLTPQAVLLTHCHFDHIYGAKELQDRFGIPVYFSGEDRIVIEDTQLIKGLGLKLPDTDFNATEISDAQTISAAGFSFRVITTPGHTPGSVCYYEECEKVLLSGDTLFAGTIGRTDLKYGDYDREIVSIMDKLMGLPGDTRVYPGHGAPTTIGHERATNPFLEPFNNPEDCAAEES